MVYRYINRIQNSGFKTVQLKDGSYLLLLFITLGSV